MDDIQAQGQGGFTLIELLVVVSIIGILAATSIGSYDIVKTQTKYANSELTLAAARTAMEAGKAESDTFTTTMSAWQNSAGPMTSSNARRIAPGMVVPRNSIVYVYHNPNCNGATWCLEDYVYTRDCTINEYVMWYRYAHGYERKIDHLSAAGWSC